jgi:hypothetical protein
MSAKLTSSELATAQSAFRTMIGTSDYRDYKNARSSFLANMNGNLVFFRTKAEYMTWITSNLSRTAFTSISAFESSLDNMVAKQANLRAKNVSLYKFMDNSDADQWLSIVQPSLGVPPIPNITNSCSDGCMNDCSQTLDNIEQGTAFNQAMYGGNAFTDAIIDAMYWSMFESAVDDLNSCLAGC